MQSDKQNTVKGFLCSLAMHGLVLYLVVFKMAGLGHGFVEPEIYSVTFEGGKKIGGISQNPDKKADSQIAPPKQVSQPEEEKSPKSEPEKDAKTQPLPKDQSKDAEISLAKPTPKPTPKPQPTKPPAKPTPAPTKKGDTKQAVKKEPTLAEINKQLEQAMQRYKGESSKAGGKGFGAAKLGGSGMGGGIVRPPEFFTYLRLLESHIKEGWRWYDNTTPLIAQVVFKISEEGEVSDIRIVSPSGMAGFDESVIRAVKKSSPVPPPPSIVYEYFKEVRMTFDPRE